MAGGSGTDNNQPSFNHDKEEDDEYVSQAIIDQLKGPLGHTVTHLSGRRLKALLDAILETQVSAMEAQVELTLVSLLIYLLTRLVLTCWQAIVESLAGAGLAGGD